MYALYVKGGRKESFYEAHRAAIVTCEAAKKHFDACGFGRDRKLPNMETLKREYAVLAAENKTLYPRQKRARRKMVELLTVKSNVDRILGLTAEQQKNHQRGHEESL